MTVNDAFTSEELKDHRKRFPKAESHREWWIIYLPDNVSIIGFPYVKGSYLPNGIRVREVLGE